LSKERAAGIAEGMEKGIEKGRAEEKAKVALAMRERGMPVSEISDITGLPVDQLLKILNET